MKHNELTLVHPYIEFFSMIWELWFEKSEVDKMFQKSKKSKLNSLINGFLDFINNF